VFSKYVESVQKLWQAALENPEPNVLNEYPRLFKQKHVERMERYLAERFNYRSSEYHTRDGLVLLALGQDAARAQLIFDYAARVAAKVYEGNPPEAERYIAYAQARGEECGLTAIHRLKAFVCLAITTTASAGRVPDAERLLEGAGPVLRAFQTSKKPLHPVEQGGLLLATLAALIARDLDTARALLAIRKTCSGVPKQFALFKQIVAAAQPVEVDGLRYLRVQDDGVHQAFFEVFNTYRRRSIVMNAEARDEHLLTLWPILGNYLFSWLYLLSFADPPTLATDWTRLREVMLS